jgi:hypothetical protein
MGGREGINMELKSTQININLRILPFGQAIIEIKGTAQKEENKKEKISLYKEPEITNVEVYEITSSDHYYATPRTTGGL